MARAPLRLGLAGGGTDVDPYCSTFGGEVLSVTIARFVHVRLKLSPAQSKVARIRFAASDRDASWEGQWTELDCVQSSSALRLHAAVLSRVRQMPMSRYGLDLDQMFAAGWQSVDIEVESVTDAPMGSGLGTSSTLVVAMLQAWQQALRLPWGEYEIARVAWEIERIDCGLQGGRQDQYAATFGGLIDMQFRPDGTTIVNPLPVENALLYELEASLVLYFTGVSRDSAKIIADQSQRVSLGLTDAIEATHIVKAEARKMKQALLASDLEAVSQSLAAGWEAKKILSGSITNRLIEASYQAACDAGAYSGKVSGAGGGGFMFFICNPMQRPKVMAALAAQGGQAFSCAFHLKGAEAWRLQH